MAKKIIIGIVLASCSLFAVMAYLDNQAEKAAKEAEKERIEKEKNQAVFRLIERTNAIINWEGNLSKEGQIRHRPIFTVKSYDAVEKKSKIF